MGCFTFVKLMMVLFNLLMFVSMFPALTAWSFGGVLGGAACRLCEATYQVKVNNKQWLLTQNEASPPLNQLSCH